MTQNTPFPQENIAQLEKLALRLLSRPFDLQALQPQLLVGRLPDPLPFDLPLPGGHSVVGSFVNTPQDIQIVLDTDQSPADTVAFYTEQMRAAGWSEPDFMQRHRRSESGFVSAFHRPSFFTTLCKGPHGSALVREAVNPWPGTHGRFVTKRTSDGEAYLLCFKCLELSEHIPCTS